ncbi:MAG TPA: DUF4830 domain-containing protein [Oscillospiraceae bacterium]|nr:DUF4830 domain-containing protein [Oscillospiraceae bacterium]
MLTVSIRMKYLKFACLILLFAVIISMMALAFLKIRISYEARGELSGEEMKAFLSGYGWTVSDSPPKAEEITIPEKFNSIYEEYNEIQKRCGFDLSKYKGKTATKYTYEIADLPNVKATILVHDGKIIGGDVSSAEYGGFMAGFCEKGALNGKTG